METVDLVEQELTKELNAFKSKPVAELQSLQTKPIKKMYSIFGKMYPFVAWSEFDPDGALVLIVELRKRGLFWGGHRSYQKGFRLRNGSIVELSERELWEYD